jgi:flagellar hook-associated protein 3 FlgL
MLNLKMAGRHLFAGTDIDTKPVDLSDPLWVAQTPPSVPNTSYYKGNTSRLSVQLSETLTVNYGVLASDPAFEQILRSLNLIVNNPGNKTAYAEALDLMREGLGGLADIRAQLSANAKTIEDQSVRNEEDIINLTELVSGFKHADLPAVTVELKSIEAQLQASYSASVMLLRMSLSNFL